MKCAYHPERPSETTCTTCGKPVCRDCAIAPGTRAGVSCSRCSALNAAEEATRGVHQRQAEKKEKKAAMQSRDKIKKAAWFAMQWGILAFCLASMALKVPDLVRVVGDDKPIREGTYDTNAQTDECIRVLWHISKSFQEKKAPGRLVCPESGKAFILIQAKDDMIARSPNPELYGFKDIWVSRKHPIPRLVR